MARSGARRLHVPSHPHDMTVTLRPVMRHNVRALLVLEAGDGGIQVASSARAMALAAVYGGAGPRCTCSSSGKS